MSLYQVAIQFDPTVRLEENFHVKYQNAASYITLAISDWLKKERVEVGKYTRIIFEEEAKEPDGVRFFEKVIPIQLADEFKTLDQFNNAQITHEYFKGKYVEGFKRFDSHFGLSLTPGLIAMLDDYFSERLVYEKEMKSKRINGLKHLVFKQYKYDIFNLVLRVADKSGLITKEAVLQSGKPDPFLVHYRVNKAVILDDRIQILGSTGKVESEYFIEASVASVARMK